ncbi:hypothetical protein BDZ45DRAFT_738790 [Acephala macrosclerotiorum]|nr:hypothetical protein BDZ45DRAFT_738790 [Acephala macrosclerotiorum]
MLSNCTSTAAESSDIPVISMELPASNPIGTASLSDVDAEALLPPGWNAPVVAGVADGSFSCYAIVAITHTQPLEKATGEPSSATLPTSLEAYYKLRRYACFTVAFWWQAAEEEELSITAFITGPKPRKTSRALNTTFLIPSSYGCNRNFTAWTTCSWYLVSKTFKPTFLHPLPKSVETQPLHISIDFDFITLPHTPLERAESAKVR